MRAAELSPNDYQLVTAAATALRMLDRKHESEKWYRQVSPTIESIEVAQYKSCSSLTGGEFTTERRSSAHQSRRDPASAGSDTTGNREL